ncbi:ribosomal protein S5 (apicoplast) [Babesia microti strain RI]|uniref:Ribosomal protein S5 n=1 Tax=Babesia microti (strain RI) TaxID=1133968 RepID=A0A068W8Z6_BABMR|nr:ribosomal protein S5 [Babesia microti strain RI]CDR32600.1 ribosomal protein S5 [Babesia microti strain RI]|eukprot:YP_009363169.1 ribosomal protein S5 (apicoplast) [Babesia microti strain RI]
MKNYNNYLFNKYLFIKINKLGKFKFFNTKLEYLNKLNINLFSNKYKNFNLKIIYKIISINRISHTLSKGRVMNYKITSCCGNKTGWCGLGVYINNKFFNTIELAKFRSINNIYIIKQNYKINTYSYFKYKGCKIKFINRFRDKFKLMKVVSSIYSVLGTNKFNLISFYSKNINILVKLLLNSLVKFN